MRSRQKHFSSGALCVVMGLAGVAGTARAQEQKAEPQESASLIIDEIIVTAQKRAENLQDISVAVSAFTDDQRDLLGLDTVQDLAKFTPSMSYVDSPNRLQLRGVGRYTNELGSDPGVATYVDGVYDANAYVMARPQIFTERIEILRGPQGTLYGRNSIGGAANVISKRPTAEFEGEFRQQLGNYETSLSSLALSGPITDGIRYRVAGAYDYRGEGYLENLSGAGDQGTRDRSDVEGQLEFDLGETVDLWVKYNHQNVDESSFRENLRTPYNTTSLSFIGLLPNPTFGYTTPNPGQTDPYQVRLNYPGSFERELNAVTVHLDWDLGATHLKYIGGYQSYTATDDTDVDYTDRTSYQLTVGPICGAVPGGCFVSANLINELNQDVEYWSNELNLSSDSQGRVRWIVGLYQYDESIKQNFQLYNPDQPELKLTLSPLTFQPLANPDGEFYNQVGDLDVESYAIFVQTDSDLTDALSLTAGLRYTWDRKQGYERFRQVYFDPNVTPGFSLEFSEIAGRPTQRSLEAEWEGATGKLGLQWKPIDQTMLYATISTGYKSGGFNLGQVNPSAVVDEEKLLAYETGVKTTLGGVVQINAAAFYYDYEDLQIIAAFDAGGGLILNNFINVPKARSLGLELETIWAPTSQLEFLLSYSYLDAEVRELSNQLDPANPGAGAQDVAGATLPQSPRNKAALNGTYTFDFTRGALSLSATYAWTDKQYSTVFNTPRYEAASHGEADLRAIWTDAADRYKVIVYGANIFDEESDARVGLAWGASTQAMFVNPPRTFGVELQVAF